jgi:hypothetical protein
LKKPLDAAPRSSIENVRIEKPARHHLAGVFMSGVPAMPVTISVGHDLARMIDKLDAIGTRQMPFAVAMALNDTALAAKGDVVDALPTTFDRPTDFTLKAIGTSRASKSKLQATVFVKDKQAKYLYHEEVGGTRTGAENATKPSSALVLPSKIPLNAFGNIPFKALAKLVAEADKLRDLTPQQIRRRKAYGPGRAKRDIGIFYIRGAGPNGKGPGGFFKRLPGHQLQRLISFAPSASYRPRFGFSARITVMAPEAFRTAFRKRLAEAIAAAK